MSKRSIVISVGRKHLERFDELCRCSGFSAEKVLVQFIKGFEDRAEAFIDSLELETLKREAADAEEFLSLEFASVCEARRVQVRISIKPSPEFGSSVFLSISNSNGGWGSDDCAPIKDHLCSSVEEADSIAYGYLSKLRAAPFFSVIPPEPAA